MTAPLSSIVNVSITRDTRAVSKAGFGVVLILGDQAPWGDRIREYADVADMLTDGFSSSDPEYLAGTAIMAQSPSPTTFKVGNRGTDVVQVQTLTFADEFVTDNTIDMNINETAITQVPFNTTHDQTMTDLATEIQGHADVATAVVTGGAGSKVITITAATAGIPVVITNIAVFGGASQTTGVTVDTTPNHGIPEDLTEISEIDDDWYGLILTSRDKDEVITTARFVETQRKIFGTASSDVNIYDPLSTTDVAAELNSRNYERTHAIFNETPADFPDAAWMGKMFPIDPGKATWMFKPLAGIVVSDLTATQRTAILNKNCNLYTEIGGADMTENGTVASGEFIDIMRGVDWLEARMREDIFSLLVNTLKVPYTDGGIAKFESLVRARLSNGVSIGLIREAPEKYDGMPFLVSFPKVADIAAIDKTNRLLPDGSFTAALAGAVHKIEIAGIVEV